MLDRTMFRVTRCTNLLLLVIWLATGCTLTGERVVPWYITRRLDGYLDFTSAQKKSARMIVDDTIAELRRGELPHWISLLREMRAGVHDGLTEDDIARLQRHYDARLDAGVDVLAPRLAAILTGLAAAQLDHFAERMREDVDEQYEELELPREKRAAAFEKRALSFVEDSVGSLSDAQEERVRALIRAMPNEREKQYASAKEHVERFRAFMAKQPAPAAIATELRSMWTHRYDALGEGHDRTTRRAHQRKWLLGVYQLLTPSQRTHLEEDLTHRIRVLKRFTYGPSAD